MVRWRTGRLGATLQGETYSTPRPRAAAAADLCLDEPRSWANLWRAAVSMKGCTTWREKQRVARFLPFLLPARVWRANWRGGDEFWHQDSWLRGCIIPIVCSPHFDYRGNETLGFCVNQILTAHTPMTALRTARAGSKRKSNSTIP